MSQLTSRRAHVLVACIVASLLAGAPARGGTPEEKKECAAAAEKGQRLRNEGKLREARGYLVTCARSVCPNVVRHDCEPWLSELESRLPTVVIKAKDGKGRDVADVRVTLDGAVAMASLDGKAIAIDPGVHVFKYERAGSTSIEEKLVVREGERNRSLDVVFEPESGPAAAHDAAQPATSGPASASTSSSIVPGALVGGLGVVALGSFAFFYLSAKGDIDGLQKQCAPRCTSSQVDPIDRKILIADTSLGASAVAFGVAAYLLFSRPAPRRVEIGLAPAAGGLVGGVGGRF